MVIIKHLNEYMVDQLTDRVSSLQKALNQAEQIMFTLEQENSRLKDLLAQLSVESDNSFVLDSEAFCGA